ncbi:hypothetical protein R3P38DRAFT_93816 [Favolaschia claudopus]|uniref:Uncharacterized protein n=1 Tax=Favolaschia claudopus TaxID=2862362 RepID=A0AAW0D795_9AGAR
MEASTALEGYDYAHEDDEDGEMHERSHWSIGMTNAALSPPLPMTPVGIAMMSPQSHWSLGTTNAPGTPLSPSFFLFRPHPVLFALLFTPAFAFITLPALLETTPSPPPSSAWSVSTTNSTPYSPTPALRSRWPSSTLASLHSSHAAMGARLGAWVSCWCGEQVSSSRSSSSSATRCQLRRGIRREGKEGVHVRPMARETC